MFCEPESGIWEAGETDPSHRGRREPTLYTRIITDRVHEVRVDVATERHRWRHPIRYLRLRPDVSVDEVPWDLDLEA